MIVFFLLFSETPISELSLELVLLQVILPALLEQSHVRQFLKVLVKFWCECVGKILNLRSYLLPAVDENETNNNTNNNEGEPQAPPPPPQNVVVNHNLGEFHEAMIRERRSTGAQAYEKPNWFAIRVS